jgi:hypothetical protein
MRTSCGIHVITSCKFFNNVSSKKKKKLLHNCGTERSFYHQFFWDNSHRQRKKQNRKILRSTKYGIGNIGNDLIFHTAEFFSITFFFSIRTFGHKTLKNNGVKGL